MAMVNLRLPRAAMAVCICDCDNKLPLLLFDLSGCASAIADARMPLQMIMAAQFGLIALPLAHWRRPSIRIVFSRAFCLREHIIIIIVWR